MARTAKDGLSKHPRHGFRLTIGKKADGKPRLFWLGQNRFQAEYHAQLLRERFQFTMKREGRDVWNADDEKAVADFLVEMKMRMAGLPAMASARVEQAKTDERIITAVIGGGQSTGPAPAPAPTPAAKKEATLYDAIKAYLDNLDGKRISESHKWRARQILDIGLKAIRKDVPLREIDYLWLDRLCDHWKSRPKGAKSGEPIKAETVVTTLRYLRTFFNWLDDTTFGGWEGPRKLLRPFRIRAADLMTPTELRTGATIKQLDTATIATLYKAGSDFQKGLILTALFTGGTQLELAVLEKSEFDLDAGALIHFRNKTNVEGRFWLPPELVELLQAEFKKHPKKPLAFYTEKGNPLVWFENGRLACDSVRLSWNRLRKTAEKPDALTFKFLRKFAADWATRNGGESMGQIALSHTRQTVAAKHYTSAKDFEGFNELQRKMHLELTAAGMFKEDDAKPKEKIEAA
jgi:hypothetical protein